MQRETTGIMNMQNKFSTLALNKTINNHSQISLLKACAQSQPCLRDIG